MKMLIVNPNNRIQSPLAAVEPPLWAGLIAGYHGAGILDAEGENLTLETTEARIRDYKPERVIIVVMGNNPSVSSTPKMAVAEALAERIADLQVFLTGIHPIALGSKFAVLKQTFAGYPMMPWGQLPMNSYRAHNWHCLDGSPRSPYASIYTSLGCPFACYYCNIHTLYGNRQVRFRPVTDVLEEVDILVTHYHIKNIKVWDELFTLNQDRVFTICDGLKNYSLNLWAYARLDSVTPGMLEVMKSAGFNWLAYGFESITDPKCISRAEDIIRMTRDAGINIIANFMFGLPGNSVDDDRSSLEFCKKHLFEFVNFYDAKPYPGSKWYKAIKSVRVASWDEFSQYRNRSSFRQYAFNDYFSNPAYLEMIGKKLGQQAITQIQEMLLSEVI